MLETIQGLMHCGFGICHGGGGGGLKSYAVNSLEYFRLQGNFHIEKKKNWQL